MSNNTLITADCLIRAINKAGNNEQYINDILDTAAHYMDDDIRAGLHSNYQSYTPQKFLVAYAKKHKEIFGEEWGFN